MIPDRFQYFLDDFWNFENVVKIWTRKPPNNYQQGFKNTRKYENIIEQYYFCKDWNQQF